jgi:hypothetical protein
MQVRLFNLDTGAASHFSGTLDEDFRATNRVTCIPHWLPRAAPKNESQRSAVIMPQLSATTANTVAKGTMTAWAVAGKDVTFTNPNAGATEWAARIRSQTAGRMVWDNNSGLFFKILTYDAVTGVTTMRAVNGFRDLGAGAFLTGGFSTAVGTLFFVETGLYTPSFTLLGDVTAGSAVVNNLRRADGGNAWLAGEVVIGDYLYLDQYDPYRPFTNGNQKVVGFDSAAKTMTMGGVAAAGTTLVGARFELFMRAT